MCAYGQRYQKNLCIELQKLDLMEEKKSADQTKLALHETIGRTDFTPDIVLIEPFSTSKDDTPKS